MKDRERLTRHLPLFDGVSGSPADTSSVSFLENTSGMRHYPKILLVDDDEATLLALSDALRLRLRDAVVDTAVSCDLAIEQLQSHSYDAVISDIVMPGHDGLTFLKHVQQLRPEMPVILVTGHPGHEEAALYGGAYALLDKPLNMSQFISVVRAALDRSYLQRRVRERNQASLSNLRIVLFPSPQGV